MDQMSDEQRQAAVQLMTTEHFTLQTARSGTISETSGRSSLFLSTVSSALVALAFIGQVSEAGMPFLVFSLVLFPTLFFLGVATFVRVLQSGVEDMIYARGINRIRHFYSELVPQIKEYFILSTHDDAQGIMGNMGIQPSPFQSLLTNAGTIMVINSVLCGVFFGLLAYTLGVQSVLVVIGVGVGALVLSFVAHQWYQARAWSRVEQRLKVMFPTDATATDNQDVHPVNQAR